MSQAGRVGLGEVGWKAGEGVRRWLGQGRASCRTPLPDCRGGSLHAAWHSWTPPGHHRAHPEILKGKGPEIMGCRMHPCSEPWGPAPCSHWCCRRSSPHNLHRADTPKPLCGPQLAGTAIQGNLGGGRGAHVSGSKSACVATGVRVHLGVHARECDISSPVSPRCFSGRPFCCQGE